MCFFHLSLGSFVSQNRYSRSNARAYSHIFQCVRIDIKNKIIIGHNNTKSQLFFPSRADRLHEWFCRRFFSMDNEFHVRPEYCSTMLIHGRFSWRRERNWLKTKTFIRWMVRRSRLLSLFSVDWGWQCHELKVIGFRKISPQNDAPRVVELFHSNVAMKGIVALQMPCTRTRLTERLYWRALLGWLLFDA